MDERCKFQLPGRFALGCEAWVVGRAAAVVLGCEGSRWGLHPGFCASQLLSRRIVCPLNRKLPSWFHRGPFPEITAWNVAAEWEVGFCVAHRLRACASQNAGLSHTGGSGNVSMYPECLQITPCRWLRWLLQGVDLLRELILPELGKQRGVVLPSETVCANDSSQLIGTNSWLLCVGS